MYLGLRVAPSFKPLLEFLVSSLKVPRLRKPQVVSINRDNSPRLLESKTV